MSVNAWKDTGDCQECRRKEYCRKDCSARKRFYDRTVKQALLQMSMHNGVVDPVAYALNRELLLSNAERRDGD